MCIVVTVAREFWWSWFIPYSISQKKKTLKKIKGINTEKLTTKCVPEGVEWKFPVLSWDIVSRAWRYIFLHRKINSDFKPLKSQRFKSLHSFSYFPEKKISFWNFFGSDQMCNLVLFCHYQPIQLPMNVDLNKICII